MEPVLKCLIFLAGAGVFGLPFDLENGPPAALPALSRYEPPAFPESLRLTSVSDGYATMLFTVDSEGRVEDAVGLEASHPAFVDAVRDVLLKWRFEPAQSDTVPRRELIQFEFRRTGMVASMSQRDASKSFFPETPAEEARPIRTVTWEELSSPPERIAVVTPTYPQALRGNPTRGHAIISFVIDQAGAVRVPVVTDSSSAEFGAAALAAVRQWRFAPPRYEEQPVNVRATRSFTFGPGR